MGEPLKDAKGHGSDERGGTKPSAKGMRLVKTYTQGPHSAKVYKNPEWGENVVQTFRNGVYQSKNDYHTDDLSDAHATAQSQLNRWSSQDGTAAAALSSGGPKSATVPIHDSTPGVKMNPLSAYSEAGEKAGRARSQGDEATTRFHSDWAKRAFGLESGDHKTQARAAFESGYKTGRGYSTPPRNQRMA